MKVGDVGIGGGGSGANGGGISGPRSQSSDMVVGEMGVSSLESGGRMGLGVLAAIYSSVNLTWRVLLLLYEISSIPEVSIDSR